MLQALGADNDKIDVSYEQLWLSIVGSILNLICQTLTIRNQAKKRNLDFLTYYFSALEGNFDVFDRLRKIQTGALEMDFSAFSFADPFLIPVFIRATKKGNLKKVYVSDKTFKFTELDLIESFGRCCYESDVQIISKVVHPKWWEWQCSKDGTDSIDSYFLPADCPSVIENTRLVTSLHYAVEKDLRLCKMKKKHQVDKSLSHTTRMLNSQYLNIDITDHHFATPLYLTCNQPDTPESLTLAKMLLDRGADVNFNNKYGRTPLNQAVARDHIDMVEFLIEKKGDINNVDKDETWMLHRVKSLEMAKLLVQHGAGTNQINKVNPTWTNSII
eukprot:UN34787